MADYKGNIGSVSLQEVVVLAGPGPHMVMNEPLAAGLAAAIPAGGLVAQDAALEVVPYDDVQSLDLGAGDGAEKDFSGVLGAVEPGSVSVTDGTETFTDDGFGGLTGDAAGTGKVNYQTGAVSVSFNAAPAGEAAVSADYKPELYGVLTVKADVDDPLASVCTFGAVHRGQLTMGGAAPNEAQLRKLNAKQIWPQG